MNEITLRHNAALEIALIASNFINESISAPEFKLAVTTKSSRTDMVTQIDGGVESLIQKEIITRFPDDSILGEEHGSITGTSDYEWVVDPIDGTTNFVYGFPAYAISIAIRDRNTKKAVAGVVRDIPRRRVFEAIAGEGAMLDGIKIRVTDLSEISGALIGTGFSYSDTIRIRQGEVISRIITKIRDIRRMGAASLDLCMVACGELDGYYEIGLQPWDYMAGALIVTEAGGQISGGDLDEPSYEMMVASNSLIHKELRALIKT